MSVEADQLSTMINHAVAPAFMLNGAAAMVAVLVNRISGVTERIRNLREIHESDVARAPLKKGIGELRPRERLLNSALHLAVLSGIGVTLLLLFGFVVAFWDTVTNQAPPYYLLRHSASWRGSLVRFLQDIRLSQGEQDDRQLR